MYVCIIQAFVIFPTIAKSGKYDFAVFENFEETRKIFNSEMKIALFLDTFSKNGAYALRYLDQAMQAYKNSYILSSRHHIRLFGIRSGYDHVNLYMKSNLGRGHMVKDKMRHLRNNITALDIKYTLPIDELLRGAVRGVIILHEAYHLNLERFKRGELLDDTAILKSRRADSLKGDDLALMAVEAFRMDCYDSSLKYINLSTISYHDHLSEYNQDHYGFTQFEQVVLGIRRDYVKYHNHMILQSSTTRNLKGEGIQWKLFPHLVDEGSNINILHFILH